MHCSRVFRSSAPSDLLPSSPGGARQAPLRVNAAALDQWNGGSAPVAECRIGGAVRQGYRPPAHPEGTLPGPVRSQGRVARCVIQNWPHVLSAPRRASAGFLERASHRAQRDPSRSAAASTFAAGAARRGPAAGQRVTSPRSSRAGNPLDKRVHSCVLACCKDQAA